ncbi:hypothetical protein PM082_019207 [Marasmius tenuissimus]|nr:hypothetical protein PM082_019207 [Marasmius tenuissimus]
MLVHTGSLFNLSLAVLEGNCSRDKQDDGQYAVQTSLEGGVLVWPLNDRLPHDIPPGYRLSSLDLDKPRNHKFSNTCSPISALEQKVRTNVGFCRHPAQRGKSPLYSHRQANRDGLNCRATIRGEARPRARPNFPTASIPVYYEHPQLASLRTCAVQTDDILSPGLQE